MKSGLISLLPPFPSNNDTTEELGQLNVCVVYAHTELDEESSIPKPNFLPNVYVE